jgi:phytoene dehydrogenase-like protein
VRADVRSLVEAFLRLSTYANAPDLFSAETAVRQIQKALGNVLYVHGGWQTLVDGLATTARRSGATIETGERASALAREHDGSYSVRLAGDRSLAADVVVLAVGPREAAKLLESAGVAPPTSMTGAIPAKMATLDLALSELPKPKHRFILGVDAPLYFSVHSAVAKLAPPGGALVHAAKYLTGDEDDPEQDRAEIEALLDFAQPGWQSAVVHSEFLPRMVVAERLDLGVERGNRGRPIPELAGLPGVYLSGDWVQGGSWLSDASFGSARTVARAIVGRAVPRKAVA